MFFSWSGLKRSLDVVGARPAEATGRLALSWGGKHCGSLAKELALALVHLAELRGVAADAGGRDGA